MASIWTAQIKVPESSLPFVDSASPKSFLSSAKEGLDYILSHRMILTLIILGLAPILFGNPYTSLMPIFAVDVLHGGARTQGLLLTMAGVGALLGALIAASLGWRQGSGKLLIVAAAGFGVSLVFFSRSPVLWMAMVFTFLAGLSNTSYSSQDQTIIQTLTAPEVRGRVLGVYLLNRGLMPVGTLFARVLASWICGPWAVSIMGTICVLVVIGVAVSKPDIWKLNLISGYTETG